MDAGKQPGGAVPRSSGVAGRPVVLVLVHDTTGSLATLLLAAELAAFQRGRLHVAHISPPRVWWGGIAGMPPPASLLADADRSADELREKAGDILALGPPVEWTFTWTRGLAHRTVTRLVNELSPAAVVLSTPRRHKVPVRPSLARWLVGRPNIQAVVVPG